MREFLFRFSVGTKQIFLNTFFALALLCGHLAAQPLVSRLQMGDGAPTGLLSSRSAVLYENTLTTDELTQIQSAFQQIGIDAILYFDADKVDAGIEASRAHAAYLVSREVSFLVFFSRQNGEYTCVITAFNNSSSFVNNNQSAWRVSHAKLHELLMTVYRDSWLTQKKENFLINDRPETDIVVSVIAGRRSELYPIDLKIDNLAIVKDTDPAIQGEVETMLNAIYPYPGKYKFVDGIPENEKDLKRQGVQYVMHFVNCRGKSAKDLLGYDVTRGESAYGSVAFPNGVPQVKTIPVENTVYKFYIKHIESGNVFLGTKWDADESKVQAMKNYIMAFKTEMKLN